MALNESLSKTPETLEPDQRSIGMKVLLRTCVICLFLLTLTCFLTASAQDSPIIRGPFGRPVGVSDGGDGFTIPIVVYEDSQREMFIPDITTHGWTYWQFGKYQAQGTYWVSLYSFFKDRSRCLKTVKGGPQSACVVYVRYRVQDVLVDTRLHSVKFFGPTEYYGEDAQWLPGLEETLYKPGPYALTALTPAYRKAIDRISAIVKYQMDSYDDRNGHQ
jgi:hypothetical protein